MSKTAVYIARKYVCVYVWIRVNPCGCVRVFEYCGGYVNRGRGRGQLVQKRGMWEGQLGRVTRPKVHVYGCMCTYVYVCTFVCDYVCMFMSVLLCTIVRLYVQVSMRVCLCTLCKCVCMFVYVFVRVPVSVTLCTYVRVPVCTCVSRSESRLYI